MYNVKYYLHMYHTYMYEVVGCLGSSLVQFSYCAFKLKAFLNHKIYKENDWIYTMQTYHLLFSCFHEAAIRKMRMKTAEFIMISNHLKILMGEGEKFWSSNEKFSFSPLEDEKSN